VTSSELCTCTLCTAGEPVPYGTCHCACGEKTNPAPFTNPARDYVKGEPVKYVKGHGSRSKDWKKRWNSEGPNPSGICQYNGCDQPTLLSANTVWHLGIIRGEPLRMCPKHKHPGRKKATLTFDIEDRGYISNEGVASDCHIFNRDARDGKNGVYGVIGGKSRLAHIVAWEALNGALPRGLTLDHLCEIKLCVNPDHLRLSTRAVHAKRHADLRIDKNVISAIRDALRTSDLTQKQIAAKFGVSLSYVGRVRSAMKRES